MLKLMRVILHPIGLLPVLCSESMSPTGQGSRKSQTPQDLLSQHGAKSSLEDDQHVFLILH